MSPSSKIGIQMIFQFLQAVITANVFYCITSRLQVNLGGKSRARALRKSWSVSALESSPPHQFIGQGIEYSGERAEQSGGEQKHGKVRKPIQGVGHRVVKLGYGLASSLSDRFHAHDNQRGLLITAD